MTIWNVAFLLFGAGACLIALTFGRFLKSWIPVMVVVLSLSIAAALFVTVKRDAVSKQHDLRADSSTVPGLMAELPQTQDRNLRFRMTSDTWELKTDAVQSTVTLYINLYDAAKTPAGIFSVGCRLSAPPSISVTLALYDRYKILDPTKDRKFSFVSPVEKYGFSITGRTSKKNDINIVSFRSFDDNATGSEFSLLKELVRRVHVTKNFDFIVGTGSKSRWIHIKEPVPLTDANAKLFETTAALCREL